MYGISFGSALLKITRPTVVWMIWRVHGLLGRVDQVLRIARGRQILELARVAEADRRERLHLARLEREHDVVVRPERPAFALRAALGLGQVVAPEHDVLRRNRNRLTRRRRQHVVRRHHQDGRLDLRFRRQRNVHRHLVAVEVGVERRADERVDPDRLAFDEHRLERLDAQPVKRGRAVQEDGMLADDLLEDVPDLSALLLDHLLGLLDGRDEAALFELVVDERLEQLERHLLRQPALVQLQLGTHDDDRTARVVDALAEQVLTEAALLALERVGQRLERPVVGATQHAATAAVVEERVHGFLEHPLLVADDHVRRLQLHELLQPVVAVDDAAVQVVQIRRREPAAVQRDERTKLGRNDRDDVQNHPLGLVRGPAERVHDLQALRELELLLRRGLVAHPLAHLLSEPVHVHAAQHLLDGFGAHLGLELEAADARAPGGTALR